MKITDLFNKGEFVITGEVGPIKGAVVARQEHRASLCPGSRFPQRARSCRERHRQPVGGHAPGIAGGQRGIGKPGALSPSTN